MFVRFRCEFVALTQTHSVYYLLRAASKRRRQEEEKKKEEPSPARQPSKEEELKRGEKKDERRDTKGTQDYNCNDKYERTNTTNISSDEREYMHHLTRFCRARREAETRRRVQQRREEA